MRDLELAWKRLHESDEVGGREYCELRGIDPDSLRRNFEDVRRLERAWPTPMYTRFDDLSADVAARVTTHHAFGWWTIVVRILFAILVE